MLSVLIVDDEEMIRLSYRKLINWENHNMKLVKECTNGHEALEYLINNPVDILLADVKMPIMDGLTLLKELKSRSIKPLVTIVLSAFDEYDFIRNAFKLNAHDYILKSDYDEDLVVNTILNVVDKNTTSSTVENNFYTHEINQVLDYINKNYHNNITLKNISNHTSYSESYISHLFSKETGVTIMEYLNKFRINKSKYLLLNSNLKIYEVSMSVGFQTSEHYCRSFKKHIGISPKQFRSNKN